MGFRDDREALRARADALEAQLRERDERFAAIEARLDRLEKEREPAPPAPAPGGPARPLWIPIAAAAGVALVITVLSASLSGGPASGPPVTDAPPAAPPPIPATPPVPATVPATPPPAPVIEPPLRVGDVRWRATVASVVGAEIEVGAACVIEARARTLRFASIRPGELELAIRCGERELYTAVAEGAGMTSRECVLYEQATEGGFFHWTRCSDRGVREGRPEITIDTPSRVARVFRSDGSLDIRLDVEPRSDVRPGNRLLWTAAPPPIAAPLVRDAVTTSVDGELPVAPGDRCELRVEPPSAPNEPASFNCRVRVRCESRYLYGAGTSGWNACEVDASGAPVRTHDASDTDGDPMLELDLEAGTLSIGSASGERSDRAVFTLHER